jgi:hypothetical protein
MPRSVPRRNLSLIRRLSAAVCCATALFCSACGDARKPVFPVHGQVSVDGRAPIHAQVSFIPVGDAKPDAVHPVGTVDDQGRFTLTSYAAGDGAPEGEYRVTVAWFLASGRPGDDSPPLNYLPAAYARPESTPLHAVVGKGGAELQPFELKTR